MLPTKIFNLRFVFKVINQERSAHLMTDPTLQIGSQNQSSFGWMQIDLDSSEAQNCRNRASNL